MMMTVNFGGHKMQIEHKTGMGNLTELWAIGNAYRERRGNPPLNLEHWLRRPQTVESLWIPAVNNCQQFGRWAFLEVKDPCRFVESLEGYIAERIVP